MIIQANCAQLEYNDKYQWVNNPQLTAAFKFTKVQDLSDRQIKTKLSTNL